MAAMRVQKIHPTLMNPLTKPGGGKNQTPAVMCHLLPFSSHLIFLYSRFCNKAQHIFNFVLRGCFFFPCTTFSHYCSLSFDWVLCLLPCISPLSNSLCSILFDFSNSCYQSTSYHIHALEAFRNITRYLPYQIGVDIHYTQSGPDLK